MSCPFIVVLPETFYFCSILYSVSISGGIRVIRNITTERQVAQNPPPSFTLLS